MMILKKSIILTCILYLISPPAFGAEVAETGAKEAATAFGEEATAETAEQIAQTAKRVSRLDKLAKVAESAASQGLVFAGGSFSVKWFDEQAKKLFEQLAQKEDKISNDFNEFRQNNAANQENEIKKLQNKFSTARTNLQNQFKKTQDAMNAAIIYLNRSISLDQPITRALVNPITWDQYFSASNMNTPYTLYPWYNIFQVNKSDWQFNKDSFWQYGLTDYPALPLWKTKQGSVFTDDPAANSIFCEYVTNKTFYQIVIEVTLINANYPFFLGIMFNHARWISGDPERLWQYRLVGLYGEKSQKLHWGFGEENIVYEKGKTKDIQSPLQRLIESDTESFALPTDVTNMLKREPILFRIIIQTAPAQISYVLEIQKNGTFQKIHEQTKSNLNEFLFLYHGIGFIASGCQAQFKLIEPQELSGKQEGAHENNI